MSNRPLFYKLVNKKPVPVYDIIEMLNEGGSNLNFRVALAKYHNYTVSTVFLGINHNFRPSGPPILFETMIFKDGAPMSTARCSTWNEAVKQHKDILYKLAVEVDINFTDLLDDLKETYYANASKDKSKYSNATDFINDIISPLYN